MLSLPDRVRRARLSRPSWIGWIAAGAARIGPPLARACRTAEAAANAVLSVGWRGGLRLRAGALRLAGRAPLPAPVRRWAGALVRRMPEEGWLALVASCLSVAFFAWYLRQGLLFAYGDAVSHMMIARQVFASRTPGLGQLGTVWLPFTPMLMLPLIWSDTLWRSGFAGSFPSMVGYVASGVYLFRTARLLFGSRAAGWVAALVFLLNPNILYLQSTAMTELVQLAAEAVALFYTVRWARAGRHLDLVLAAGAVAAGSLVRYDAWALAASITLIVGVVAWRKLGRDGAEASLIVFGTLAFAGCAAWVLYNWVIYHDPLYFLTGPYSAQGQQRFIEAHQGAGALPTHHHLLLSLQVYGASVLDSAGWPLAALAALGLGAWMLRQRVRVSALPLYAALTPFAFNCLSLFLGISTMWTPDVAINGVSNYFNVRYGVMMLPAVALLAALWAARSRLLLLVVLGAALVFSGLNPTLGTPYVLAEPLHGVLSQGHDLAHQEGQFLAAHYHGGGILFNAGDLQSAIFFSGLPYSDFITAADNRDFPAAIAHPEAYATWIILDPYAGNYDPVYAGLNARQDWRQHYRLAAVIGTAQIYELVGGN